MRLADLAVEDETFQPGWYHRTGRATGVSGPHVGWRKVYPNWGGRNLYVVKRYRDRDGKLWLLSGKDADGNGSGRAFWKADQFAPGVWDAIRPPIKPPKRPYPIIPKYSSKERISFRNEGRTCICVATILPWMEYALLEEGLIRFNVDIFQLGYSNAVTASAGTHARGGGTDTGQHSNACLRIERELGICAQRRTPAQGFSLHNHWWPLGCPHKSSGLRYQEARWLVGRNGLVSDGRVTGPGPIGRDTPNWKDGLLAYKRKVGAVSTVAKIARRLGLPEDPNLARIELDIAPIGLLMPFGYQDGSSEETARANTNWIDPEEN